MDYHIDKTSPIAKTIIHSKEFLTARGYKIHSLQSASNKKYNLCLSAYYHPGINAKCWLRFDYGCVNAKPSLTATSSVLLPFHASLCASTHTADICEVFGKTHILENLRFYKLKKGNRPDTDKKVVLFAPTYNDELTVEEISDAILTLKKDYYVIIKSHHATEYRPDGAELKNKLIELADEYADPDTSIAELLMRCDACLVNNSSAWADAVYAGVPVAILSKNLDQFRLGEAHTPQYKYVHTGYLPHCNKASALRGTMKELFRPDTLKKQKELAGLLFPPSSKTGVKGYLDVINYYLSPEAEDYLHYHDHNQAYVSGLTQLEPKLPALEAEVSALKSANAYQEDLLHSYQTGKLYRLSKKLYDLLS